MRPPRSGATLLPVDSEHNAIFQCLAGNRKDDVSKIILTASGGPFRTASPDAMAAATPGAGRRPSQLVDGRQDLGRFGDADEQGPRADRGALSVRPSVGADRHRHPSAIGRPFAGRVRRRLGARAARRARHAHSDRLRARLAGADRDAGRAARPRRDRAGSTSKRPTSSAFPALRLAREALEAGGAAPIVLNAANEVAVASFLAGADPLPRHRRDRRAKRSARSDCAAPRIDRRRARNRPGDARARRSVDEGEVCSLMLPQPPLWLVLIAFVCALGPLVFFHELGHYLVARAVRHPGRDLLDRLRARARSAGPTSRERAGRSAGSRSAATSSSSAT